MILIFGCSIRRPNQNQNNRITGKMPPKFYINNAAEFKQNLVVIKELTEDATFGFRDGRLCVFTMDSSHVCLVHALWTVENLNAENLNAVKFALNLKNLIQALSFSGENGITFEIHDDTVSIQMDSTTLALRQLDGEELDMDIPEISPGIDIDASVFSTVIKNFALIDDSLRISTSVTDLIVETQNETFGNVSTKIDIENGREVKRVGFSTRYIATFVKSHGNLSISIDENMPGVFTFKSPSSEMSFYLAPKMEEDMIE